MSYLYQPTISSSNLNRSTSLSFKNGLNPNLPPISKSIQPRAKQIKNSHPIPRAQPISPTPLIPPMPLHKPAPGIYLQTPKDILGVRDASIVRRMPIIIHMNMPTSPSTSSTPLTTRTARPIASCASAATVARSLSGLPLPSLGWKHGGAGAEVGAARGSHGAGLRYYIRVLVGMDPDDRLHKVQKAMVLLHRGGRGGDRRCGTDCELGFRGVGGEEGEDVGFV